MNEEKFVWYCYFGFANEIKLTIIAKDMTDFIKNFSLFLENNPIKKAKFLETKSLEIRMGDKIDY